MKQRNRKTGSTCRRFTALLLMLCLILTTPGISAPAGTAQPVSGNGAEKTGSAEINGSADAGQTDDGECNIGETAMTVSGNSAGATDIQTVLEGTPENPVHHHTGKNDGSDTTEWSYVYFGSYPQGEVTDETTKSAIDSAISQGKGQPAGTEGSSEGIDVWVGNTKYRRISKSDCNNSENFDNVENNGYRYFKWKRIKWRVLQNDGSTLFVAADMALDCKKYNDASYTDITWENCTLRSWLNNSFYQAAFTGAEQGAIVARNVVNEDNPGYGTEGGNDTTDNVYLLSIGEVTDEAHGFCSDYNVWSDSRRLKTSDYADARGAWISTSTGYEGNCWWWLRSPGYPSDFAARVSHYGFVYRDGYNVGHSLGAVVPALHINLSSDLWSMTDDGGSGLGGEDGGVSEGTPENPVHHHTGKNDSSDTTEWSYVYFGSYPQGEVTDETTKSAIDSAISQGKGQPAGAKTNGGGADVWVDGTKYRRISKEDGGYSDYFDNVENNGYRYFKWERIKWRVLQNDGNTLFVAADMVVDCKKYNDTYTDITWENCTLRSWLNNSFYQTAFTGAEQGAIVARNVVNEDNSSYGTEGGNDTTDNVYLLSIGEVTNAAYGFCSDDNVYSDSRRLKTSDYANARGAWRSTTTGYEGNCWWWLRSPGDYSSSAATVYYDGYVYRIGDDVDDYSDAVVPALHINLSSDLWSMTDDGTSGSGGEDGGGNENGVQDIGGGTASMDVKVSGIRLTGISKKIAAGKKIKLTAEVLPENAADKAVTWTSSNPKYATVDANGVVRTKKAGAKKTVTITATAKDGSGVRAEYKIKIMKHAVKKVKITTSAKSVKAGKNLKLKAAVTATGKNANKKPKWTSSNESYATVSSKGVVKTTKAGKGKTVTITAMATDGSGKKAKVKIKIK